MEFKIITIFPELFEPFSAHGMIRRAVDNDLVSITAVNLRDYARGKHRVTDDRPYGGGSGMVMKPEPLAAAICAAKKSMPKATTILLSPQGRRFSQKTAEALTDLDGLILVCGRYEGVDERICDSYIDLELSIGDFVLTGGELAAMIVIDAVSRLIPGVLGGEGAAENDSFADDLLEHAQYTRPRVHEGSSVPDVLLSGHHDEIAKWRLETSFVRTLLKRGDLLSDRELRPVEIKLLKKWYGRIGDILEAHSLCRAGSLSGGQ